MGLEKIKISLDYMAVMHQAEQMEDEADKLQRKIRELKKVYSNLKRDWEGPASRTFLSKLSQLINSMSMTYNQMNSAIRTIRSTAKAVKEADEREAEQAEKLN